MTVVQLIALGLRTVADLWEWPSRRLRALAWRLAPYQAPTEPEATPEPAPPPPSDPEGEHADRMIAAEYLRRALRRHHPDDPPAEA